MIAQFISRFLALAGLASLAAGCASAPSRFYTLNSTAQPAGLPAVTCAIVVGPVTVPAMMDHPQITVQVAPNRVEEDELDRWAEPLEKNIARVVAGDLAVLLGTTDIATAPWAKFGAAYQVTINVERFNSLLGKSAELEALWVIQEPAGGTNFVGHTFAVEPVMGVGYEPLAAAHSRALAKLSGEIAARIRAELTDKPKSGK